jgi:steroid delta-isomerase-like uncharacterized protein
MSLEENKAIVRKMFEAINKQNLAELDEVMSLDFVLHMHAQQKQGLEDSKQVVKSEMRGFPDLHVTVEDIIAEEDRVCVRLKETATHTGEYRGLAPTGNKLSYTVAAIWRISDGKIVEGWIVYDQLEFLEQLGVVKFQGFPDEVK